MSNKPKGFKRMPIFHITGFNHSTGKVIIESFDERLPNDEYYYRLIKRVRKLCKYSHKHIGSKGLKYLFDKIRRYN